MDNNKSRSALPSRQLNWLDCFAFAYNDESRHPEGTRAQALRREPYLFNASVKNPKDLCTQSHVITRKTNRAECGAVCQSDRLSAGHIWQTRSHVYGEVKCQTETQSDVVIPNKFDNGETCNGLLRRFVRKITNDNENSPHNDMNNKILKQSWIIGGSAGSTQPSPGRASLLPKSAVQDDLKKRNELIPLFPYFLVPSKESSCFAYAIHNVDFIKTTEILEEQREERLSLRQLS